MGRPPQTGSYDSQAVTINNGQQVSLPLDLGDGVLVGLILPAAFTGTQMTFQVSDGLEGTYVDLYEDGTDNAIVTVEVAQGQAIGLGDKGKYLAPFRYVKLKSGSAEAAERSVIVVTKR